MIVFKNYFKIISKHLGQILLYFVIFLSVMLVFVKSGSATSAEYRSVKPNLVVYDDSKTTLSKGLVKYLDKNFSIKDIPERLVEDELFYGGIQAVIRIPKSFDKDQKIIYKSSPKSTAGELVKQRVNSFINTLDSYKGLALSDEDRVKNTLGDMDKKAKISIAGKASKDGNYHSESYFNFLNYVIMAQLILVISLVMTTYKREMIYKRNAISPLSQTKINSNLIMGHLLMGLIVWSSYMILFIIFWPKAIGLKSTKYMMINTLVFTTTVVALAMLISKLVTSRNALSGIMNVVALGSSFISGAMVPQAFLSETTLSISKILPSYYFITNNNKLVEDPRFSTMSTNLLVMLGFTLLFALISHYIKPRPMKD